MCRYLLLACLLAPSAGACAATPQAEVPAPAVVIDTTPATPSPAEGAEEVGPAAAEGDAEADERAKMEEVARALAELDIDTLEPLGKGGEAVDVLAAGEVSDAAPSSGGGTLRGGLAGPGSIGGSGPPPPGPKGAVAVAAPVVSGGPVANAASVVARMRGRFRRCHEYGLLFHPGAVGTATVGADLGPNGEVTAVRSTQDPAMDPVAPCLKAVMASAQFSAPGGGSASLEVALTFTVPGP